MLALFIAGVVFHVVAAAETDSVTLRHVVFDNSIDRLNAIINRRIAQLVPGLYFCINGWICPVQAIQQRVFDMIDGSTYA